MCAVRVIKDNVPRLMEAVKRLTSRQVLIGIPAENNEREDATGEYAGFGNAAIGYLNEFGRPESNIPPRPHLVPGVQSVKREIIERMKALGAKALEGKFDEIDKGMAAIGILCVGAVQKIITAGIPPPLAASTLYKRKHRKVAPRMGETPLIDTGQYRQHITYVLANKQGTKIAINPSRSTPEAAGSDTTGQQVDPASLSTLS